MRIGILSRNRSLYSTRRLLEAGRRRGHDISIIDTLSIAVEIYTQNSKNGDIRLIKPRLPVVAVGGWSISRNTTASLPRLDAIIPRIGATVTEYGLAVVRQFEARQLLTTATSQAIAQSRDKLHSLQIMSQAGLLIPKTAVIMQPETVAAAVRAVGGFPVIIKVAQGTQGRGVLLARNMATATAILSQLKAQKKQLLIQEFVAEAEGKDIRVIVVGDRCVAAMQRQATHGEFRANLHLGATSAAIKIDKETARVALAAAAAHGLSVAGVDIIHSRRGPMVLEVNSSPGLEGIEKVTQIDVAAEIIRYLEKKHRQQSQTVQTPGRTRKQW